MPRPSSPTLVVAATALLAFALLTWRASLPNNRQQGGMDFVAISTDGQAYYVPRALNEYENAVTLVTARHFARQGFLATHFLPNRGGHPLVSLYDKTRTMCVSATPPRNVHTYWNGFGEEVAAASLNNDCIYTHYPPLAEWIFGGLAVLGFDTPLCFKTLAILGNCAWLVLLFAWLRRLVHVWAAALTVPLAATLPSFLQWGDTLFYHPFQFPLLLAGLIAWQSYLAAPRARYLLATWSCYFLEALASYQLTLCFGIVAFGMCWIAHPAASWRARSKPLAMLALAPLGAFALHFALVVSYSGLGPAWANLRATYLARVSESTPGWIGRYGQWIDVALFPLAGIPLALVSIVALRRLVGAPGRCPLAHLGLMFLGGASFAVALPGTTSEHTWMMYRHFMPFVLLLVACLLDALMLVVVSARAHGLRAALPGRRRPFAVLLCGAACVLLVWLGLRNAAHVRHEVAWNRLRNHHENPANLARRAMDVVFWNQGAPRLHGNPWAPLTGWRGAEPPGWRTDLRLYGEAPWHYEIWWAEPVDIQSVRLLLDEAEAAPARDHCAVAFFDEVGFGSAPAAASASLEPFRPTSVEAVAAMPRTWLDVKLATPVSARALRVTCTGLATLALRQVEAYASPNPAI
jgi:hypothetical protein